MKMKLLKLTVEGLPLFKDGLSVDFIAQQRVDNEDKEYLFPLFSNVYTNPVLSFIGINASGKTTILRVLSFVMRLLNNEAINNIAPKKIFDDLCDGQKVRMQVYFYQNGDKDGIKEGTIKKLESIIEKRVNVLDGSEKLVFYDETLWTKKISGIKTRKTLYDFSDMEIEAKRDPQEQYLLEDVSIIVALNKKQDTKLFLYDTSDFTDYNLLNVLGRYPREILTFLDPSIEYLNGKPEGKKADIRLKFYGKDEIALSNPLMLNRYLSSGTIKGLSVFMGAIFTLHEGGCLIIDEVENHFNREIVSTLIRFFLDRKMNKNGATLIFSTHYSELLDEFERNDNIYIVRNIGGITAENLSNALKRNDIKKSEVYKSDFLKGTAPSYDSYIALKKVMTSM